MTECTRFEDEGLRILEEGGELHTHFESCETCIRARARYDELKQMLAGLDADAAPASGWEDNVLSEVRSAPGPESTTNWGWLGSIAAGIGAIALVILLFTDVPGPSDVGRIDIALSSGGATYRGDDAKPGDRLMITAQVGDAAIVELRIYRDGERLVLACADQAPCRHSGDEINATVEMQALGEYQAVLMLNDKPLPDATGTLDTDVLAARDAGATVTLTRAVSVR